MNSLHFGYSIVAGWDRNLTTKTFFLKVILDNGLQKKQDANRGIIVNYDRTGHPATVETNWRAAEQETAKILNQIEDFLSTIASKCSERMFRTVINEATSMDWIIKRIRTAFRLQSKGINFYDATLQGYNEDKDGCYDMSYMKLKDMYEDLLLPEGTNYHESQLLTNEALTPLSESFIVI